MTIETPDSPYVVWDRKGFEKELEILLARSSDRIYRKGEVVYVQGETDDAFFFIKKGRVKVSILKAAGSEKILAIQESNTLFGEYAAFDRHPHFATATAIEDSEICRISIDQAEAVIEAHPRVAFLIIKRIVRKLRSLVFHVEGTFFDAQRRIAHILLSLAKEVGEPGAGGVTIRKGMTHERLASLTGLSRVRVTTILNNFERTNIIRKKRGTLTITDIPTLRMLVEDTQYP